MPTSFFVSDLHGDPDRYVKLFARILAEKPAAVFVGGDILPSGATARKTLNLAHADFIGNFLTGELESLRTALGADYPRIFVILGNDDCRSEEAAVLSAAASGVWEYIHDRRVDFAGRDVYGYACVPPTPFLNKDWERYDVSRYVEPGSISPEDGYRSIAVAPQVVAHATIRDDLAALAGARDQTRAIWLFHTPPYQTGLDRAALDGKMIDYAPLDVHVGSIAVRRFIEDRRPAITLHGHIHESARITGRWSDRIGDTCCFSAAHDGPELALVRFDPDAPASATRELL